ncbi:MAG: A/G-specific adenine glycosylase [Bryobacteraceae bacterium]|nr:MAG: A/G-specific adenine glycosylase [Bryobacteraceae bacterium]
MRNPRRPAQLLLEWYASARRDLPWRRTRDPWRVLVSEVMLQQTRVSVVIPYYERFLARFPSPQALAGAEEEELLALWAGLGYYSRARNLKRAAEAICARGGFPETAEEWRALPGIGEYTAAAVASICFREPVAVLDGNVARVMARLTAEEGDIASGSVRLRLKEQAQALLEPAHPGDFNQALMELGATVCLPRQPKCLLCPWQDLCQARRRGLEAELPVKARRRQPERVALRLALIVDRGRLLLRRRPEDGRRLAGFWELPSVEELGPERSLKLLGRFRHSITHHNYEVELWHGRMRRSLDGCQWHELAALDSLPLGAMTRKALALWQS